MPAAVEEEATEYQTLELTVAAATRSGPLPPVRLKPDPPML